MAEGKDTELSKKIKDIVDEIKKNKKSLTGEYLSGRMKIEAPASKKSDKKNKKEKSITIVGASAYNLKKIDEREVWTILREF